MIACPFHKKLQCERGKDFRLDADCRLCWLSVHAGEYRLSSWSNDKIIPANLKSPCAYRGDQIPVLEGQRRGLTHLKVWYECEKGHGPQCMCNKSCGPACPDYEPDEFDHAKAVPLNHVQNKSYPSVGVSIGSYGFPSMIELQAATIRANCGDIPILVSDDHTEEAGEDGLEKKLRILDVCDKYGLIYRDAAPNRVGHSGGDLGAFYHGLNYAAEKKIDYWLKLSQRFIIDRPLHVQKCAAMMRNQGHHTMSQTHMNRGRFFFAMRTEYVLHDVKRWFRPDIMEQLRPRQLGSAAENVVHGCVKMLGGAVMASPLFTAERSKPHAGLVWYEQPDAMGEYKSVAKKYGVTIGTDFHVGGSHLSPGYKVG